MSYPRCRTLWIVGCLLFVMLVAGCTAVQGDVEPPVDMDIESIQSTQSNDSLSNLKEIPIASSVETVPLSWSQITTLSAPSDCRFSTPTVSTYTPLNAIIEANIRTIRSEDTRFTELVEVLPDGSLISVGSGTDTIVSRSERTIAHTTTDEPSTTTILYSHNGIVSVVWSALEQSILWTSKEIDDVEWSLFKIPFNSDRPQSSTNAVTLATKLTYRNFELEAESNNRAAVAMSTFPSQIGVLDIENDLIQEIVLRDQPMKENDPYQVLTPHAVWSPNQNFLTVINADIGVELIEYGASSCLISLGDPETRIVQDVSWHPSENRFMLQTARLVEGTTPRFVGQAELYIVDLDTATINYVAGFEEGFEYIHDGSWSPDGNRILFRASVYDMEQELLNTTTREERDNYMVFMGMFQADTEDKSIRRIEGFEGRNTGNSIWVVREQSELVFSICDSHICQISFDTEQ